MVAMPKKKKLTKSERREQRLRKTRQWVLTYEGSHIVRAYRKRFNVDPICAMKDLEAIGALSPEKLAAMREAEALRLQQRREERERKQARELAERHVEQNGEWFFIAGYTSGGAPYGVTWAEMGMEPWEFYGAAEF